ncbi:response regulator [Bacillus subtilis]|uniref:response regulator n=1 Tax=Pseudochrobactrum asaccharolyticum TaxID=354351 RepID=UPI001EFFD843|nr:response regulator [Pseudochrobactrum asaccharolyticum]MCF7646796.1 response regulator [Pseudochrobactrum asaccharolyticum]MCF7672621.1 response regulator [Bacillus subtilis]
MTNALILIIEDEPEIADILRRYFEREGYRTVSAGDGETGLSHHLRLKPDLVVLDVKLPRQDGFEVLSVLRQRGDTPVIMVTALAQDIDKLQALRSGADDYVVKPFNPLEVVARAKVVLRRAGYNRKRIMRVGALLIDMDAHTAIAEVNHQRHNLDLTRTEFRLLAHMAQWPNRVFERGELVDACLPEGGAVDRTVDSHISKLRRKLHEAGVDNQLTGVRGVGYRLEERFV